MEQEAQGGRRIGKYELREEIGRGGMAVVYRALDTTLDREVALKLLHPHLTTHLESRKRFHREARAVARLRHPSILEIYDYSDDKDEKSKEVYIVMELVRGTTLRRFLQDRQGTDLSAEGAALVIRQVADAVAHAHANGIIHRDVKPENILIGPGGNVKLSDFGIAQLAGLQQMTATGQILGSPAYMSPEHVGRAELEAGADIFSMGTVLYEMSVGRPPFDGKNPHATIKRIIEGDFDDPLRVNPAIGHHVSAIIRQCLRVDPADRYTSAEQLIAELDRALETMEIVVGDEELRDLFQDPEQWIDSHRSVVIDRSLGLGFAARKRRALPEAMDHFNRVLSLDPGNDKALGAVAGLARRRRVRRVAERSAQIMALLVAVGALVWMFAASGRSETGGRPQKPALVVAPTPGVAETPLPEAGKIADRVDAGGDPADLSADREKSGATARPSAPRILAKREVVFTPNPMAVQVVIDGKERFPFGPANRARSLTVGPHRISFVPNDPDSVIPQSWEIDVPAGEGPFLFRRRLTWRPATLLVRSNVQSVVTIPKRTTGKTNEAFKVEIKEGPTEQVSVLVSAEGYHPRTSRVRISAGQPAEITMNLAEE